MAIDLVPQDKDYAASGQLLRNSITVAPHNFLRASSSLHGSALLIAKYYLDPLADSVSNEQYARLQAARRKRKRGENIEDADVLRLKQLHLQDFSIDQVWEQSKRILSAAARELESVVDSRTSSGKSATIKKTVQFQDDVESSVDDLEQAEITPSEDVLERDLEDELEDDEDEEDIEGSDLEVDGQDDDEDMDDANGLSDIEADESDDFDQDKNTNSLSKSVFTKDKHGLNDGFFSIDDFNRATEFLEQVDTRGDPNDGAASDEEDIDWAIDPMNQSLPEDLNGKSGRNLSDGDDDGPTFGDADLDASWSEDDEDENSDNELEDQETNNANEIYYKDFFEPPPRALTKTKRMRALPKTQPVTADDDDIQRTISAVHRDIFSDDDVGGSDESGGQGNQNLSTHERRQKALAEQIRKLEAEAVAKRQWTLTGEARAADRPMNSLLEDDLVLDFERTGKPVPEATAAVTEAIEDLIKARILARNFDEVPKRLAGANLTTSTQGRRGLVELDDRKNQQSLAEIYENEHLKATDPNYVDSRDVETKKAHQEIELLWKDISHKLDALTSLHYKPKPADMEVRVVTDAPRIEMEDARPSGAGIGSEQSGLAPQEVYRVGEELKGKKGDAKVVLTSGGALVSRAELTRDQKVRMRRREKERIKKKGSGDVMSTSTVQENNGTTPTAGKAKRSKKADEKKNILDELRRGNVKVIGKGGAIQDVEGRKAKVEGTSTQNAGVGRLKL